MIPPGSHRLVKVVALLLGPLGALSTDQARGAAQPAACFGAHMVLQRDVALPVWGTAEPGEEVVVVFGDARADTVADAAGRWRVTLPPRGASSEPRQLVIRGSNEVRLDDVLVGEVWLCAGQSNMLMPLVKADHAAREIAEADRPGLRLLALRTAAGGDPPPYTPAQVRDLEPGRFCTGQWEACTPGTARHFSAIGYFFGAAIADALDVPVGIVCVAVGGSPTEAWVRRAALAADPALAPLVAGDWTKNPALAGWCAERAARNLARAATAGESIPGDDVGPNHPFKPGFLWDSCVAPLVPFAIRGVAWYQGESNAESPARVAQHTILLRSLVADWRHEWTSDAMPFAVVQLPGMDRPDWPAFRETQRLALAGLASAGLVVTIDLGRKDDVHPPDKRPIGERIARWAIAETSKRGLDVAVGPTPVDAESRPDGTVAVRFMHAGAALAASDGKAIRHFEVAGADGVFHAVAARIEGDAVLVTPPAGGKVARVRYAWMPFPVPPVNLVNSAGLPATPFVVEVKGTAAVRR